VVKQPLAKDLIVQSLEAMDISENMASVSTQNDEIFFMVSYVNEIDSHYNIINEQIFKELLFDSLHHIYQWKDKIALNEIDYIVFSLVELDDYNSHKKVEKLLKAKINKGVFLQEVNHSEMDSLLSYDDFLGMKYLKREEILQHKKIEVRISGRHLLDKYDYSVNIIGY
jgi:hypothetical protein